MDPKDPIDPGWLAGLRRGDPQAFSLVYERLAPRVFAFLVRLCGRTDLAEDLSQETWVKLARHAGRLAPDTELRAWLFTVARNQYRSHRRWLLLDFERLLQLSAQPQAAVSGDPERAAIATRSETVLSSAIARLPLPQREVLLLSATEGYEPHELAQILGLSQVAVRQRLLRARKTLANALREADASAGPTAHQVLPEGDEP